MRPSVRIDGRKPGDPRLRYPPPQYDRVVHLGLILPNFGEGSTREGSAEGRGGGGARLRLGLGVTTDAVQILGGYGYTNEHPSSA